MIKEINIPIICQGSVLEVPVEGILVQAASVSYAIKVEVPAGLTYSHAALPKGSYDSATDTWNVGSVSKGELVEGLLYYTVVNDAVAPFEFSFLVDDQNLCSGTCVKITGLTCYQLSCCDQATLGGDFQLVAPVNATVSGIDVTANTGSCYNQTFAWLNTAGGKVTGTPQSASYTPGEYFGSEFAEFGIYCNGRLKDTARVHLCTTYAAPTTQYSLVPTNAVSAGNVGSADLRCTCGGGTTWHLKNAPTGQGDLIYLTSNADVTVTNWDQNTGNYQVQVVNSYEGLAVFDYFMRCTANGQTWDSSPGQEIIESNSAFPFSSSNVASSSGAPSSSAAPSSSQLVSSSVPASSSDTSSVIPPSSSATSSVVPASSSILIPSSNPAASSSVPFSSSNPVSSSVPASSGVPASSSFAFLSSSNAPSSSQPASSSQ